MHWQQLLTEIKKTRSTFDTSETRKSFGGVCVVEYEQVQARVNGKYDSWQKDILSRFGVKLGNVMREMHASILKARNDLWIEIHRQLEATPAQANNLEQAALDTHVPSVPVFHRHVAQPNRLSAGYRPFIWLPY
jgi:hypothetical protein